MDVELPTSNDDFDHKLLANIARVGWGVIGIPEDDEGPGFAFSVGLYRTHGHPEVILIGLPWDVSYALINDLGASVKDGKRYEADRTYDDLTEGSSTVFITVDREKYREYFGAAMWFYRGKHFPALQWVWPDRAGAFPWSPGQDPSDWQRQPLLGQSSASDAASR